MNKTRQTQRGFTIIELMIATTIFALILMICLAAIMHITRMYYQGTLQARTQNRVREIVDEIADEIRYRPGDIVISSGTTLLTSAPELEDGGVGSVDPTNPEDYYGQYCVGSIRYRYLLGFKTESGAQQASDEASDRDASRPLIRENMPNECGNTEDLEDSLGAPDRDAVVAQFIESSQDNNLLDENMRIVEFEVSRIGDTDKYRVAATVAYGDDDLLGYENGRVSCRPNNVARAYCAVAGLEVVVTRRKAS